MTSFWSAWIIILTVVTLVLTTWILFANRTRENPGQTTGHVFDGIEEYDNPMPMWWFIMFVLSLVFGVAYLVAYPGMGNFPGLLDWSQQKSYEQELADADTKYGPLFERYANMPVEDVASDTQAMKMAGRIFANNCALCHGADARGGFGFPNLADNTWLYGGSAEQIKHSITHGRTGAMPGWEAAMGADGVAATTAYVLSLSGREADTAKVTEGEAKYQMFCVACHGPEGKGNQMMGAPDLTDDVWLYGGSPGRIKQTIASGRNGQMPAHDELLNSNKIHLLSAYVYQLSNPPK
jgi:cytochrome c oxidase cbb3-type subunit 3